MKSFKLFFCVFYLNAFSCNALDVEVDEKSDDTFVMDKELPSYYSRR